VKPLDEELICDFARRAKRVITVEENSVIGGFGSAVLELLQREEILVPVTVLGAPDEFVHHGAQKKQRQHYGLDADGLLYTMRSKLAAVRKRKAAPVAGGVS
jgi:1-deoxy-D-xylulose-5-phosphate synthase